MGPAWHEHIVNYDFTACHLKRGGLFGGGRARGWVWKYFLKRGTIFRLRFLFWEGARKHKWTRHLRSFIAMNLFQNCWKFPCPLLSIDGTNSILLWCEGGYSFLKQGHEKFIKLFFNPRDFLHNLCNNFAFISQFAASAKLCNLRTNH